MVVIVVSLVAFNIVNIRGQLSSRALVICPSVYDVNKGESRMSFKY